MRIATLALATLSLLAASGAQAVIGPTPSGILNGDFEDANLEMSGWNTYASYSEEEGGSQGFVATDLSSVIGAPDGTGTNVAILHAGRVDSYQRLWQDFDVTGSNASLSMLVQWRGADSIAYNDNGYARIGIVGLGGGVAESDWFNIWTVDSQTYPNDDGSAGYSPWLTKTYSFAGPGRYRIEFGIANIGDDYDPASEMAVDNVRLTDPVPEPGEWAMIAGGLGLVGAAARRRRRS